jgi:hypothetical protein
MRKTVIENARFNVGASPGFRTLEITDPDDPLFVILVPMESLIAAQLARHLMEGDPDPDELRATKSDSRVVRVNG